MLNKAMGAHSPRQALFALTLALFSTAGCSGTMEPLPPRVLSESNRASLGTIGVRITPSQPKTGLFDPFGEGNEALPMFLMAGAFSGGIGIGVALVAYPIVAAINRIPDDKVAEIETFAGSIFNQHSMQEKLRASVAKTAWTEAGVSLVIYDGTGEDTAGESCLLDNVAFDQILDLRLPRYVIIGTGGSDPSLELVMEVESRLIDAQTCNDLYADRLVYSSENRKFSAWSDDRKLAHDAVNRGLQGLAEHIVEDLFLFYPWGGN